MTRRGPAPRRRPAHPAGRGGRRAARAARCAAAAEAGRPDPPATLPGNKYRKLRLNLAAAAEARPRHAAHLRRRLLQPSAGHRRRGPADRAAHGRGGPRRGAGRPPAQPVAGPRRRRRHAAGLRRPRHLPPQGRAGRAGRPPRPARARLRPAGGRLQRARPCAAARTWAGSSRGAADVVAVACGTGGTLAGLAAGLRRPAPRRAERGLSSGAARRLPRPPRCCGCSEEAFGGRRGRWRVETASTTAATPVRPRRWTPSPTTSRPARPGARADLRRQDAARRLRAGRGGRLPARHPGRRGGHRRRGRPAAPTALGDALTPATPRGRNLEGMIRAATPADIPVILRRWSANSPRTNGRWRRRGRPTEQLREALFGAEPVAFALIAEEPAEDGGAEPVGFALWFRNFSTWTGTAGRVPGGPVRPARPRGAGHGKALLAALAAIAWSAATPASSGRYWTGTRRRWASTARSARSRRTSGPCSGCRDGPGRAGRAGGPGTVGRRSDGEPGEFACELRSRTPIHGPYPCAYHG